MDQPALTTLYAMCDGYRDAALVQFANRCGVLVDLAEPIRPADIAAARGWCERRTTILVRALTARGICEPAEPAGVFVLTAGFAPYVLPTSDLFVGDVLEHSRLQWELWGSLDAIMVATEPHRLQQEVRLRVDHEASDVFNRAMQRLAVSLIDAVVEHPVFAAASVVVDIGGGHGDYLRAIAVANPGVHGQVWDVESSRPFAEENFRQAGLQDRLGFVGLDLSKAVEPSLVDADVVMINDCLHYFDPAGVERIVSLAEKALKPGGCVSMVTPWLEGSGCAPADAALFSFYMMVNSFRGGVHPVAELVACLERAGLGGIQVQRTGELDDSAHVLAFKGRADS